MIYHTSLTSVVSFYRDMSYISFIVLFMVWFNYLRFIVLLMLLLYTHCSHARAPYPLFTHSLGRFLTTLNLHIQILDVLFHWSGVRWDRTHHEELEFPSAWLLVFFTLFYSCCFRWFLYIGFIVYSISVFFVIMCGHLYILLQWS